MDKKYIIFDLDGTLIKSNNNLLNAILDFFKRKQPKYYDTLRYTIDIKKISSIKQLLTEIYWRFEEKEKELHDELYEYLDEINKDSLFIDWTIEKILELKDKYKLYLSTWSSTKIAKEILEKSKIAEYFEVILWSDKIPKSEIHLDMFMENSGDKDFFINSVSIWDWVNDEIFAKNKNIEFIKIWDKIKGINEIKNI